MDDALTWFLHLFDPHCLTVSIIMMSKCLEPLLLLCYYKYNNKIKKSQHFIFFNLLTDTSKIKEGVPDMTP